MFAFAELSPLPTFVVSYEPSLVSYIYYIWFEWCSYDSLLKRFKETQHFLHHQVSYNCVLDWYIRYHITEETWRQSHPHSWLDSNYIHHRDVCVCGRPHTKGVRRPAYDVSDRRKSSYWPHQLILQSGCDAWQMKNKRPKTKATCTLL